MNYTDKIFEMLGIEFGESFRLTGGILTIGSDAKRKYRLTSDLILQYHDDTIDRWVNSNHTIAELLADKYRIKLIKEPTEEDKIVVAYAKLCDCNWISMDEDGAVYGTHDKPTKGPKFWNIDETDISLSLHEVSFISWEDEEPYYIGDQ